MRTLAKLPSAGRALRDSRGGRARSAPLRRGQSGLLSLADVVAAAVGPPPGAAARLGLGKVSADGPSTHMLLVYSEICQRSYSPGGCPLGP